MLRDSSFDENALTTVRRAYAKQMLAIAGVQSDPLLEEAFATVPRERFLGSPPWRMVVFSGGYRTLPSCEPVLAYQDIIIALDPERGVNNGSPSLHAKWLHHADLREGGYVAHIGAGTGYYTALIAHLVSKEGRVYAVELDPTLAEFAKRNLAHLDNVTVIQGDGSEWPREAVDCVYVNFLVQRPAESWIEYLKPGGCLIFPLGVPRPNGSPSAGSQTLYGAGLRIERLERVFAAQWLGAAFFVCAEGILAESHDKGEALKAAFERGGVEFVRSLQWKQLTSLDRCWFVGSGWSLSYDEPAANPAVEP